MDADMLTTTTTTNTGSDSYSDSATAAAREEAQEERWARLKAGNEPREPVLVHATYEGMPCEYLGEATFAVLGFERGNAERYALDVSSADYDPIEGTGATGATDSGDEDSGGDHSHSESAAEPPTTALWVVRDNDEDDDAGGAGPNHPGHDLEIVCIELKILEVKEEIDGVLHVHQTYTFANKVSVAQSSASRSASTLATAPGNQLSPAVTSVAGTGTGTSASAAHHHHAAGAAQAGASNALTTAATGVDNSSEGNKESEESLTSNIKRAAHRSRRL